MFLVLKVAVAAERGAIIPNYRHTPSHLRNTRRLAAVLHLLPWGVPPVEQDCILTSCKEFEDCALRGARRLNGKRSC
jgi:hypothetical protein